MGDHKKFPFVQIFFHFLNMPYVRRSRRGVSRGRRARARGGRLSTARVLTRKSATSQAFQINALNKKINRISRSIKPDVKFIYYGPGVEQFNNGSLGNVYKIGWYGALGQGNGDNQRLGDKIFVRSCRFYMTVNYYNDAEITNNFDDEAAQLRVVFFQARHRAQFNESGLTPENFLQVYGTSSSSANYLNIPVVPLVRDITERYDILRDFSIRVDRYHPHKQYKIRIPLKRNTLRYDGSNSTPDRGIGFLVVGSGLNNQTGTTERIIFTDACKLSFTESRKK